VIAAYRYRYVTHISPRREPAQLAQVRPDAPRIRTWIIHLQRGRSIRIERPLEQRSYSSLVPRYRHCPGTAERKASAKDPQLARYHRRPRRVDAQGQSGLRRPGVSRYVVVIQRIQGPENEVAPPGYVHVPIDYPKSRASQRNRHAHPAGVPRVEHWIILPYLPKAQVWTIRATSTYKVDLPVEVP
jgi:hypothetical protein